MLGLWLPSACSDEKFPSITPARITHEGLREYATGGPPVKMSSLRENQPIDGIRREVMAYSVDGLQQHALVLWPSGKAPENGWPVLLFNHGYHPDPPRYGRIKNGTSDRPGDYYRGLPQAFAQASYVVVAPDYRGHNDSEGNTFIGFPLAPWWYTRDVIGAFRALPSLPNVNTDRVYMHGHSMGAAITQRALLALGPAIRSASIWSSSGPEGGSTVPANLDYRPRMVELRVPLLIQHASGDAVTPANNSRELAGTLSRANRAHELVLYDSDNHLFEGENYARALRRDLAWFERHP